MYLNYAQLRSCLKRRGYEVGLQDYNMPSDKFEVRHIAEFQWHFWVACPVCGFINMDKTKQSIPRVASIRCKRCNEVIHNKAFEDKEAKEDK